MTQQFLSVWKRSTAEQRSYPACWTKGRGHRTRHRGYRGNYAVYRIPYKEFTVKESTVRKIGERNQKSVTLRIVRLYEIVMSYNVCCEKYRACKHTHTYAYIHIYTYKTKKHMTGQDKYINNIQKSQIVCIDTTQQY